MALSTQNFVKKAKTEIFGEKKVDVKANRAKRKLENSEYDVNNIIKSYMTLSYIEPKVGEKITCKVIKKDLENKINFSNIELSAIQSAKQIAENMFIVINDNKVYVMWVLNKPQGNVYFAIIDKLPQAVNSLICKKLDIRSNSIQLINWKTSLVSGISTFYGLYKIETKNSTYFCLK